MQPQPAAFTSTALPTGGTGSYTYQWQSSPDNITYTNIAGATSTTYAPGALTAITYYRRQETSGSCGTVSSNVITININPLPQGTLSANGPICASGTGQLTFTSTEGTEPFTISYSDGTANNVSSGTPFDVNTNPVTATTTYTLVSVTDNNGCIRSSGFTGSSATITVYQPPVITSDPAPSQTVCATFPVSFTVGATGDGLTYQWFKGTAPGGTIVTNTANITGATTATLNIAQAQATDAGDYYVVASGSAPCTAATSAAATLIVDQKIVITSQPTASQTLCLGSTFTVSVSATGTVALYKWFKGGVYYADATNDGSGNYSLTIPSITAADAGSYQLTLDDGTGIGCPIANSNPAVLVVNATSVGGTVSSDQIICSGTQPSSLTLSGNTGNVIKWQSSADAAFTSPTDIIVTSTTLTGAQAGTLTSNTYFRAVVQNGVCVSANSSSVLITIDPVSVGGSVSADQTICSGTVPTSDLTLSGNTGNVVKWQKSTSSTFASGVIDIANTSTTLTAAAVGSLATTTYFRAVVQSGVCSSAPSASATITVNPVSVGGTVSSNAIVCSGSNSGTLTLAGQTGNVIRWESSTNGGGTWTSIANTTTSQTYTNITQTTLYRAVVQSGVCASANSSSVTITVNQNPTVSDAGGDQSICGTSTTLSGNMPTIGTGTWSIVSPAGGGGGSITTPSSPTSTFSGTAGTTYTLRRTISNSPCPTSTDDVIIALKQNPTSNAGANKSVCATSTSLAATNPSVGTGTWSVVSGPVGYSFSDVNSNTSTFSNSLLTSATTYVLRWTVSNPPCANAISDVTITFNPPITNDSIYLASLCRDPNTGVVQLIIGQHGGPIAGGNGTYTYSWEQSCNGSSSFATIAGQTGSSLVLIQGGINCFYKRHVTSSPCTTTTSGAVNGNGDKIHININNNLSLVPYSITPYPTASYCNGGLGVKVGTTGSLLGDPTNSFTPYSVFYKLYLNGVLIATQAGTGNALDFGYQTTVGTYTVTETITLLTPGAINCSPYTLTNSLIISIDANVTPPNAGPNQTVCANTIMGANTPIVGTGLWSLVTGTGTITTPTDPLTSVTGLGTGANTFKWKITNGTCADSNNVTITAFQPNVAASSLNKTNDDFCNGTSTATLTQTGGSLGTSAVWKWYSDPGYTMLVGTGSGASASITVSPSATTTYYLRAEGATAPCAAITESGNVIVTVKQRPTASLSGSQNLCNGSATLTLTVTGTGTISGTLSDGTAFSGTAPTITVNVSPAATTTYTVSTLSDANCTAIASDLTGSTTVTVLSGAAGLWTGAVSSDWFDCNNWANGYVPTATTDVTIPATNNSPQINAAGAQSKDITINGGTLSFGTNGTLEVYGDWNDNVVNGFTGTAGTVIFSGSSLQTINTVNATETFYNLQINKTSTASTALVLLNDNITVTNDLTLTEGIFVTGYNLFTFNNTGTLTLPVNYTDSYIATSDAAGNPINAADAYTPFAGNVGFRIKNVGPTDTYFPVGASYLPAENGELPSPNRMMINNTGAVQDFTVVVNYGDIGYTNGGADTWKVNRIWYVSASSGTATATMQLFFTKRDWTGWGSNENEVEAGFDYTQMALVQKDYSGGTGDFINLSKNGDIQNFSGGAYDNKEVYAQYTFNSGLSLTNGIQQFNRFSIVNPGDIILPVKIINLKAYQKGSGVQIDWTALNEVNVGHYEVERSTNAISFTSLGNVNALNNAASLNYSKIDPSPVNGNNFYRIKAVDKNGAITYTGIVPVNISNGKSSVSVYPNPVQNRIVNVQFTNLPAGNYNLILYNTLGQPVLSRKIEHAGGSATQSFTLPVNTAAGAYTVKLFNKTFDFTSRIVVE